MGKTFIALPHLSHLGRVNPVIKRSRKILQKIINPYVQPPVSGPVSGHCQRVSSNGRRIIFDHYVLAQFALNSLVKMESR